MPQHDLIVIGAGPGGYVAAIRAAQLGKNVACVEREPLLGGTCLRVGCMPSKAMLESSHLYEQVAGGLEKQGIKTTGVKLDLPAMLRNKERVVQSLGGGVDSLFKKNRITRYFGHGRIDGPGRVVVQGKDGTEELTAPHILIATGSKPATLPGIELDGDRIGSSTEALCYDQVPPHLVVIGAGYIGLEMGTVWRRLGAKVTILEYLDRILPGMDSDLARDAKKLFEKQGLTFQLGCKVTGVKLNRKTCDVEIEGADPIRCDKVLVAVGRKPNTDDLGLDSVNVETDHRGFIAVNGHYQTGEPTVYAVGDVIGGQCSPTRRRRKESPASSRCTPGTGTSTTTRFLAWCIPIRRSPRSARPKTPSRKPASPTARACSRSSRIRGRGPAVIPTAR